MTVPDIGRYTRQTRLPEIGEDGQRKLAGASVLCVGAGGLGAPALLYLAAAGVGRIGVIDFDRVDDSNLQRQVIFSHDDIGHPKASRAAAALARLNPHTRVEAYDTVFDAAQAHKLVPAYDLIIDGTDNFETKFLVNDAACTYGRPWVYGAIQGFEGRVSVFNHNNGPCYRCLQPAVPKSAVMNCAEAGVIGTVAGMVGITQAMQAVQVITGHAAFTPLSGRLWMIDMRDMQGRILSITKNAVCPACAGTPGTLVLHDARTSCSPRPVEIPVQAARDNAAYIMIDVREQNEWQAGHIAGALFWPLSRLLAGEIPDTDKAGDILLYCQRGARSLQAAQILQQHGFSRVASMAGGYAAWCEAN